MPSRFLLQILRRLVAHGILRSSRGVDGGYALERAPEEISLLDLIEAIDGPLAPSVSPGDALPAASRAKLEQALSDVTRRARDDLGAIMLSDLLPRREGEAVGVGSASVVSRSIASKP